MNYYLATRIVRTLHLMPMTVGQLSQCLSASKSRIRQLVDYLPQIERVGQTKGVGRPWIIYGYVGPRVRQDHADDSRNTARSGGREGEEPRGVSSYG